MSYGSLPCCFYQIVFVSMFTQTVSVADVVLLLSTTIRETIRTIREAAFAVEMCYFREILTGVLC